MQQKGIAIALDPPLQEAPVGKAAPPKHQRIAPALAAADQHQAVAGGQLAGHAVQEVVGKAVDVHDLEHVAEDVAAHRLGLGDAAAGPGQGDGAVGVGLGALQRAPLDHLAAGIAHQFVLLHLVHRLLGRVDEHPRQKPEALAEPFGIHLGIALHQGAGDRLRLPEPTLKRVEVVVNGGAQDAVGGGVVAIGAQPADRLPQPQPHRLHHGVPLAAVGDVDFGHGFRGIKGGVRACGSPGRLRPHRAAAPPPPPRRSGRPGPGSPAGCGWHLRSAATPCRPRLAAGRPDRWPLLRAS